MSDPQKDGSIRIELLSTLLFKAGDMNLTTKYLINPDGSVDIQSTFHFQIIFHLWRVWGCSLQCLPHINILHGMEEDLLKATRIVK